MVAANSAITWLRQHGLRDAQNTPKGTVPADFFPLELHFPSILFDEH